MEYTQDRALLRSHAALHPGLEMEDVVKLLYQSEFGGGHLIDDPTAFYARLEEERAACPESTHPVAAVEPIGGGYTRVHLAGLEKGLQSSTLARLCALSAGQASGSAAGFLQRLKWVPGMIEAGELPISAKRWNHFIEAYSQRGCPPLHHSERFRARYAPHYRVLAGAMAGYLPVFAAIDRALLQKPQVLVGIDGMCASGKSGLAELLQAVYGCGAVHADHFFLREGQRSEQRLAQPGGNIDYERLAPVAAKAGGGQAFSYQPYNCQTGQLDPPLVVPAGALCLLEGSYALHPKVGAVCDVRVFLCVEAEQQARRVWQRSGPVLGARFMGEWIPMENRYFAAYSVRESCDVVVDTTRQFPPPPKTEREEEAGA